MDVKGLVNSILFVKRQQIIQLCFFLLFTNHTRNMYDKCLKSEHNIDSKQWWLKFEIKVELVIHLCYLKIRISNNLKHKK